MSTEDFIIAVAVLGKADRETLRKYIAWVKFKRMVHNHFYFAAHWIKPKIRYHWVGE